MPDQHGLDLCGTQPLASDLDRLGGAPQDVPQAVLWIFVRPVAMHPHVLEPAPVRVEVALLVTPETTRHARPWIAERELADLSTHRFALCVEYDGGDARHGARERTRAQACDHVAAEDAARNLRAARVVDDGDPSAADVLEKPLGWLRGPRA